jgi:hypothetical protein
MYIFILCICDYQIAVSYTHTAGFFFAFVLASFLLLGALFCRKKSEELGLGSACTNWVALRSSHLLVSYWVALRSYLHQAKHSTFSTMSAADIALLGTMFATWGSGAYLGDSGDALIAQVPNSNPFSQ